MLDDTYAALVGPILPSDSPAVSYAGKSGSPSESQNGSATTDSIEALKQRLVALERRLRLETISSAAASAKRGALETPPWSFGDRQTDRILPGCGLDPSALHEIKPGSHGDWPSALGLALRFALRRIETLTQERATLPLLWCQSSPHAREQGRLYAPGLASMGLRPDRFVVVETTKAHESLWAMEEGLRSGSVSLVVGCLHEVGLTESRRLSLAAMAGGTPCLLMSSPRSPPAPAAATRWRVSHAPSGPHPLDPASGGAARFRLRLERCRGKPLAAEQSSLVVEWCDATHRFCMASGMANRPPSEIESRLRAG